MNTFAAVNHLIDITINDVRLEQIAEGIDFNPEAMTDEVMFRLETENEGIRDCVVAAFEEMAS